MQSSSLTTTDLLSSLQHNCAGISASASFDAALIRCAEALSQLFHADSIAIYWYQKSELKLVYGSLEQISPPPDLIQKLCNGQTIVTQHSDLVYKILAPLRKQDQLLGWLDLHIPTWNDDLSPALSIIISQAASTLAAFDIIRQQPTHFETLSAISQHISSELELNTLLDTIYKAIERIVNTQQLYITLLNPISKNLELVYLVNNGVHQQIDTPIIMPSGLKQIVLSERKVITAEHYAEE